MIIRLLFFNIIKLLIFYYSLEIYTNNSKIDNKIQMN